MTHLTILALGSRGDVLPCAVLGQGLQAAGFAVRLISSENFAPMAAQYGLDFCAVPGDAEALLTSGGGVRLAESGQSVWKMWRSVKALFWDMATGIEAIVPHPPDWGPNVRYTGYWRPEEPEWTPPDALINFLAAGSAPVFVGFGSMPVRQPQQVTQLVLEALQRTGQRAVLQAGWAGIGQTELPDTVYLLDYAPYSRLFPQMAAVIHHGGSGTTGFGFWAGVPTILTPFLFDQFYWGRRIEALGVGPSPIPQKKLTAAKLAGAIDTAVSNSDMHQRAAKLGQRIRQEDGVANAVDLVNQIIQNNRR